MATLEGHDFCKKLVHNHTPSYLNFSERMHEYKLLAITIINV